MAKMGQSDRIRQIVREKYVRPAILAGQTRLSIKARDVLVEAEKDRDFPRSRTPTICQVLESKKLLDENHLEIESIDGPPAKRSRTVVVHYRVLANAQRGDCSTAQPGDIQAPAVEDSAAWARRVTSKMAGLLKDELAAYGGGDAFMKWVRSDGEDDE